MEMKSWKYKGLQMIDEEIRVRLSNLEPLASKGVGFVHDIEGRLTTALYVNILKNNLIPTLDFYELKLSEIIFQQDTTRLFTEWLRDKNLEVLKWPAQSPDLNPIEHLWFHLKKEFGKYDRNQKGIFEV